EDFVLPLTDLSVGAPAGTQSPPIHRNGRGAPPARSTF
ncbi:hypothetical protein A2U01_0048032, partial [Trifolium medium]|nr:hypothetical protein [Trifolium medium]